MNDKQQQIDIILKHIVEEISITSTMLDKAVKSYEAVGKWLGDGIKYDIRITPQGSMNLGTTNKPMTDEDDYDIDLVCLLENGMELKAEEIKKIVGDRLKENEVYHKKILKEGEGKRCWKMSYDEFHMDILPCVPKTFLAEKDKTEIRLTHKNDDGLYENRYSNPSGYRKWFESRMKDILQKERQTYAIKNKMEIEDVPAYRVKTPLQMTIQLLKRHRDIYFQTNDDNAPISIILTTLAAHSYRGEANIHETICNILDHMIEYIEIHNGVYWIQNPVMAQENFADKWQEYPERRTALLDWIKEAKKDFITNPLNVVGIDQISKIFEKSLGEAPVKRAMNTYADEIQVARKKNKLYSTGLLSGLTTTVAEGATVVKGHTFFGE